MAANSDEERPDTPRTYPEPVADFIMCDSRQERHFAALSQARSPFAGASRWPRLEEVLAERSRQLLAEVGEEQWRKQGGTYDNDTGEPTFRKNAATVSGIVRELATEHGGLLYWDRWGIGWAVRLLPGRGADQDLRTGLAVTWYNNPLLADEEARRESLAAIKKALSNDPTMEEEHRRRLEALARRLRLFHRAQQLLWLIHAAVRKQRSSTVVLPDETLAQAVWGAHARPKNWRQDLLDVLASLSGLCVEQLHLTRGGWSPRLDSHAVAVASVTRLETTRGASCCDVPGCPLQGSDVAHGHFVVQMGLGFLGVLENHAIKSGKGNRRYDFSKAPSDEAKQQLQDARKAGRLVTVSLPVKIFGPANWSKLSAEQQNIIQALIREVTRHAKKAKPPATVREDRAETFAGNRVPGSTDPQSIVCPYLKPAATYVAFNGNGRRRGRGYGIIGAKGTGWLHKCGYTVSKDRKARQRQMRRFLGDLGAVAAILGLTVVGYHGGKKQWATLQALQARAGQRHAADVLEEYTLRVYGPPDYHDRLHRYFEQQGQMTIPRLSAVPTATVEDTDSDPIMALRLRMQGLKVTQEALGEHLGCSQQFVTKLLNRERPWPEGVYQRATAYLEALERQAGGETQVEA
jgi:hypothetical protein